MIPHIHILEREQPPLDLCPKCKSDKWVFVHEGFMCHECEIVIPDAMGVQIAHIPPKAKGDITHPDVEYGFITNIAIDIGVCWVRYWLPPTYLEPGEPIFDIKPHSEMTPLREIVLFQYVPEKVVEVAISKMARSN